MPFTDESQIKVAFKKLIGRAHTTNDKEFFNEAKFSQISIFAFEVFGQNVPSDPQQAINDGLVEYVEADLVLDGTSNGKSYTARFPSGYNGFFGSGVAGTDIGPVASAIPASINSSLVDSGHTGGFAPGLYDNGVLVPATSTEDWIFDPVAMVVTSEDDLSLGSTGTLQIYLYTGKTVQDHIDDTNNPHQLSLEDLLDLNISGSNLPSDGDLLIFVGGSLNEWQTIPSSSVGVTDHGELTGLTDDDHTQYIIENPGDDTRNVIQPSSSPRRSLRIMSSTDGPGTWDFFDITTATGSQLMRFENNVASYSVVFESNLATIFNSSSVIFHNAISLTDSNDVSARAIRLRAPSTLQSVLGYDLFFPNGVGQVGDVLVVTGTNAVSTTLGFGPLSINDLVDVVIGDELQDGYVLQYVGGSIDQWQAVNPGGFGGGVTDHGDLDGLLDDDHTQYVVLTPGAGSRNVIQPSGNITALTVKAFSGASGPLFAITNTSDDAMMSVDPSDGEINFGGSTTNNQTRLASDASSGQKIATFPNITGEVLLDTATQNVAGTKTFDSLALAVKGGGVFSHFLRSGATATHIIDMPDISGNMVLASDIPSETGHLLFANSTSAPLGTWRGIQTGDLPDISLDDLSDVINVGASDGDVLVFVGGSLNYWEPQTISNIDNIAPADASYVTASSEPSLPSSRLLAQGTGIQILDSGPGSNIVIATQDGEIDHSSLSNLDQDDHLQYVHTDPATSARNLVTAGNATVTTLTLRGAASQSANLFLIEDDGGSDLLYVRSDGDLVVGGSIQGGGSAGTADSVGYILDNSGLGGGPRTFTFPNQSGELLTANSAQTITGTKTFDFLNFQFAGPSVANGWILTTGKGSGGYDALAVPAITTGGVTMLVTEDIATNGEFAVASSGITGAVEFRGIDLSDLPEITIDDLIDVDVPSPTDGYVLTYVGGSINTWQAQPLPSDAVGILDINGETGSTQTFSDVDDTNVTLTITSASNDHEFALGWSGLLPISRGGTGGDTFLTGGVILGGASAFTSIGMSAGTVLIGNSLGAAPTAALLTAGTGIDIVSAAGSITISTDDSAIDHGSLAGLGDDDHSQYIHENPSNSSRNIIGALGTTVIPLSLRGAPGHTANLLAIEDSGGTDLATFSAAGTLTLTQSGADLVLATDDQSISIGTASSLSAAAIWSVSEGITARDAVLDYYGTSSASPELRIRRARGTFSTPGNLDIPGDDIGSIVFYGYNSSAGTFVAGASLVAETTEVYASNAAGTKLEIRTLNEGSPGSPTVKVRLDTNGVRLFNGVFLDDIIEQSQDYVLSFDSVTKEVNYMQFDLSTLTDIDTTGSNDGDILVYEGGSVDQWRPFSIPGEDGNLLYRDQDRIGALPRLNWDDDLQTLILGVQQTGENSAITDSMLEIIGDGTKQSDICLTQASSDVTSSGLVFWKSRGTLNIPANVQDNDRLGEFFYYGQTGVGGNNGYGLGGSITLDVDGTVTGGSNFVPTTLTISTSDGSSIFAMVQVVNGDYVRFNNDIRLYEGFTVLDDYVGLASPGTVSTSRTHTLPESTGNKTVAVSDASIATTHALFATATSGAPEFRAIEQGDISGVIGLNDLIDVDVPAPEEGVLLQYFGGSIDAWLPVNTSTVGVTDHGDLTGLADDDHTQYVHLTPSSGSRNVMTPIGGDNNPVLAMIGSPVSGADQSIFYIETSGGTRIFDAVADNTGTGVWAEFDGDYVAILDDGQVRFYEAGGGNYIAFKASSLATDITYLLPESDASGSSQFLSSNAAGKLTWQPSTLLLDASGALNIVYVNGANNGLTSTSSIRVTSSNEMTFGNAGVQGEIYIISGGSGGVAFQELPFQGDHTATIVSETSYSADFTLTLPGITGTFMMLQGTQTVSGPKTFEVNAFSLESASGGNATINYIATALDRSYIVPVTVSDGLTFAIAQTSTNSSEALFATSNAGSPEYRAITTDDIADFSLGSAEDNSYLRYVGGSQNEWVSEVIPGDPNNFLYNKNGILGAVASMNWDPVNESVVLGYDNERQFNELASLPFEINGGPGGSDFTGLSLQQTSNFFGAFSIFARSRGTIGSELNVNDNDFLGSITAYGRNGGGLTGYGFGASIDFLVDGTVAATTFLPTRMQFRVGIPSGLTSVTPLIITSGGLQVLGDITVSAGNVDIAGDLTVRGTTTTIDTQNLVVEDNFIVVNSLGLVQNAGIEVDRGHAGSGNNAFLLFNEDADEWYVDNSLGSWQIARKFVGSITGTGADSVFTVTHGMGTDDVIVQVWDSTSELVSVQVEATSVDEVDITFKTSPAPAVTYTVVVVG